MYNAKLTIPYVCPMFPPCTSERLPMDRRLRRRPVPPPKKLPWELADGSCIDERQAASSCEQSGVSGAHSKSQSRSTSRVPPPASAGAPVGWAGCSVAEHGGFWQSWNMIGSPGQVAVGRVRLDVWTLAIAEADPVGAADRTLAPAGPRTVGRRRLSEGTVKPRVSDHVEE